MASIQSMAGGIVALLLVVIMVGVVAAPLITDIANGSPFEGDNEDGTGLNWTFKNKGQITSDITMVASGNNLVIGENTYRNSLMGGPHIGVISDTFMMRISSAKEIFIAFDDDSVKASTSYDIALTASSGGAYSVSINSEVVKTGTFNWILYPDDNGTWGRFSGGAIVSPDQMAIIGYGITTKQDPSQPYSWLGTLTNNTLTVIQEPYAEGGTAINPISGAEVIVDAGIVGNDQVAYKYNSWKQTWPGQDDSTVTSQSMTVIYAPIHYHSAVTADSDQMTSIQLALIGIVPTLLAVVAVVVGARMITRE